MLEQMRPAEVKILAKEAFGKAAALKTVTCNVRTQPESGGLNCTPLTLLPAQFCLRPLRPVDPLLYFSK